MERFCLPADRDYAEPRKAAADLRGCDFLANQI